MASILFDQYCIAHEVECASKGFENCVFIVDTESKPFDILSGKKILVVDDEPDILDSIKEILHNCVVKIAGDFETASTLLQKEEYDAAVLDIMGVNGYELLEITRNKKIPTLMLTAHALNPENFIKTIKDGAQAYVPKEKLFEIKTFLTDVLTNHQGGVYENNKWFIRLEKYFSNKFGSNWKEKADPEFWKNNFYN
ncbi:MAG: response regulator [Desulfobacteraceae bacterium]|nr:response regulator [Desulfobacteraceae bacterium]